MDFPFARSTGPFGERFVFAIFFIFFRIDTYTRRTTPTPYSRPKLVPEQGVTREARPARSGGLASRSRLH